jgi:3-deoxy-D-manno-octulosonate 8-phosphate phosphatase (KDO 8-P phosphatase)
MSDQIITLFHQGGGEFISPPSLFSGKLKNIRAVLFDWDGVFNDGSKRGTEGSIFSEVDSMGTNLLRYALWKANGSLPAAAVITGENNPSALLLARRENFHFVYSRMKNKAEAFAAFCSAAGCKPDEVAFFFDDVLDLEVARQCGIRIMIGRSSNPMLRQFVKQNNLADYITAHDGGKHGLREGTELLIGLLGMYDEAVRNRMAYSNDYREYLSERKKIGTSHVEGAD